MPIHDWRKVNHGTFHDFRQTWIIEIKRALNANALPAGYYAMAEQTAGGWGLDVRTLEAPEHEEGGDFRSGWKDSATTVLAVQERPPKVAYHAMTEVDQYARKASSLVIRHSSHHRVVAMIGIDMPLFLQPDSYVPATLETTYQSAWDAVPEVWRNMIEKGTR